MQKRTNSFDKNLYMTNQVSNNQKEKNKEDQKPEKIENYFPNFISSGEIYSIILHNDKTLIIGDGEDKTYFYDIKKKNILSEQKLNKESISFLKLSYDIKYLISTSNNGEIILFSPSENFKIINKINDNEKEINWIEWNPKGPMFALGYIDGSVWIYLAKNLKNPINFFNHYESCTCGNFTNDGFNLVSCGEDGLIFLYNLKERKVIKSIKGDIGPILCMDFMKEDKKNLFVVGSLCNEIMFVSFDKGKIIFYQQFDYDEDNENYINDNNSFNKNNNRNISNNELDDDINDENNDNNQSGIESIIFCNNNKFCVFSDSQCNFRIFDMTTMQIRVTIPLENENITKLISSKMNNFIIYGSGCNGYIYIIDTRGKGNIISKKKMHNDVIMDFVISEKEEFIISSSLDKTINYFQIPMLKEKKNYCV
jgi:WD40 repeat protein